MNREHTTIRSAPRHGLRGRRRWLILSGAAAVLLAACSTDRLLDVSAKDRVDASLFDDPANASLMVRSATGDFECAHGSWAMVQGIISDEFVDAQLGAAAWPYDRRDANVQPGGPYGVNGCDNNQTPGLYLPLSTARFTSNSALTKLEGWTDAEVPNRSSLTAQAALYAGFSYALMGMSMCEAAFDLQAQIGQPAMFALAEDRFSTAITAAQAVGTSADAFRNAALVGRARVRLYQNKLTEAAADAALVPSGFNFNASRGSEQGSRFNRIWASVGQNGFYSVDPASRNLTTGGVADPRATVVFLPNVRSADNGVTPIYVPAKYTAYSSPLRIASYVEAQLIRAEALGGSQAVTIINALRDATTPALPHYTGATDAASIRTLIIEERRRALFAEGFRNYDYQRFTLPLTPAPGTPYPLKGGTYGNTTCLPLPDIERFNNPNITP
jgi:starch-binding outer membrane protein, SusD/RagB family